MIGKLKQTLERNGTYERKDNEKPKAETSIKERLKALNNSANLWQQKVVKTPSIKKDGKVPLRRNSVLKQEEQRLVEPKRSTVPNCDISSGLRKFFEPSVSKLTSEESGIVDLDAIQATPILRGPTRARAPNRKRGNSSHTSNFDERIRLEVVKLNEDELMEHDEEDPEKLETQAQAIAALKNAKTLLKSPTKKSQYPEIMLIQIRGSKHTDVRLVAPFISSIHENACFVVVHHNYLVKYEGEMANILEKTKCAQLCIEILGKNDLNCAAGSITEISSKFGLSKYLGKSSSENEDPNGASRAEDRNNNLGSSIEVEEAFENRAAKINLVMRVAEDRTLQTCSRRERVSVGVLKPEETLILDFGTEIYVWSGRSSSKVNTAYAVEYAKQLMSKPISTQSSIGELSEGPRPEWVLFRKIHQGVLDTLFKAKFIDWPDKEIMTTCRPKLLFDPRKLSMPSTTAIRDPVAIDSTALRLAERMRETTDSEPILILEDQEIDRQMKDIVTEGLSLWELKGEVLKSQEFSNVFDSSKCYVLKWQYRIQKSGVRRIKTGKEEERETGRTRVAFFYWLGAKTTPKLHGLCALRIKDIDRENSPRIRVVDGNEPALFLALFEGKFVVRSNTASKNRRFVVTGANSSETSLREVEHTEEPLRSHAAYIETEDEEKAKVICGADCAPTQVRFVLSHYKHFVPGCSKEERRNVEVQGDNPSRKWIKADARNHSMRIWRMFDNEAEQMNYLSGHPDCAFTFSQDVLNETVLIDIGGMLWIWTEDVITTFMLKVADQYWKNRNGRSMVVYKGGELPEFRALFKNWDNFEVEGSPNTPRNLKELLDERCRTFSVEELKRRDELPAGMDMRRLESYLSDEDFEKAFKMSRNEFYSQQSWKQNEARKRIGLF